MSTYLWTAHNALVPKLCDLTPSNDTIGSVSWVQKGRTLAVGTLAGRFGYQSLRCSDVTAAEDVPTSLYSENRSRITVGSCP